jgi:hypothetical protein
MFRRTKTLLAFVFIAALAVSFSNDIRAQTANDKNAGAATQSKDDRAEQILQRAVEAQGGGAYLAVHSVTGRGFYTQFDARGMANEPSRFVDYQVFPDRERTEFRTGKTTFIQTNVGASGWFFDGLTRAIRDLTPAQIEDFRIAMRTSVDNVLHGWWRKEGAKIEYIGRREAGLAKRNEVMRLTYPDGFSVEFEFGAKDFLPAKILYKRRKADTDSMSENNETLEEDRLLQYINVNGIMTPYVIDHYRDGKQTSRINYLSVEFNKPIPESLFARPSDVKSLK